MMRIASLAAFFLIFSAVSVAPQDRDSEDGLKYTIQPSKPSRTKAPVIIFLHGTGGNRGVWGSWAAEARKRGYIVVTPKSTGTGDKKAGNTNGDKMPRWADVDVPKLVSLAKEVHRKYNGDPKRTYVGGYSNGAFYAMEVGLRHPEVFSAILCIGGGCNVYSVSKEAKRLGAYIIHGTNDNSVRFDVGKKASEQLKTAGLDVVFKKKDGKGHVIFEEEAKPFFDWVPKFVRPYNPGSLDWESDYDAALEAAKEKKTLVWAFFYSAKDAKSASAEGIEYDLLRDPKVKELSESYVLVKVDREAGETAKSLKIRRPTLAIINSEGKIIKKFERPTHPTKFIASVKRLKK